MNRVCTGSQSGVLGAPLGKLGRGGQVRGYRRRALWGKKPMKGQKEAEEEKHGCGKDQTREAAAEELRTAAATGRSREGPPRPLSDPPYGRISFHAAED